MTWNPSVPAERRYAGKMSPGWPSGPPTHVVCHITGTDDFEEVRNEFLTEASAHYVIDKAGVVHQFVEEDNRAWHAGIKAHTQALYAKPPTFWRRYLHYFDFDTYPAGSVYLDEALKPLPSKVGAVFVARADGSEWPKYDYFKTRWGATAGPLNYQTSHKPNDYAIAIEILSFGAATPSATAYTPAMYASLTQLVTDICQRHRIPRQKGRVAGHEDVNPVQRYGWDPNQGFDWSKVWA